MFLAFLSDQKAELKLSVHFASVHYRIEEENQLTLPYIVCMPRSYNTLSIVILDYSCKDDLLLMFSANCNL